ncbi:MAG: sulfotransferase family 2 domain-containing protein [Pseudomonadota bacterium]
MATFIDERMRFFFVHVPKTGGMTVSRFFERSGGRHWRLNRSYLNSRIGIHDGVEQVTRLLGPATASYFSFAYYRNSWDWAYSLYRYVRRTPGHPRHHQVRDLDFSDYVHQVADDFFRPQRPLVCDTQSIAVTRLEDFRQIATTLPEVLEELGYTSDHLAAENQAPVARAYTEVYDAATRDRIAALYRDDIAFFDFRFGD